MKQLKYLMIMFLFLCFVPGFVYAQETSLDFLDIEVQLLQDGSANIVEKRTMQVYEGTEIYIPIGNLGKSTVTDLQVSEEGKAYTNIGSWNVKAKREEKKGKCGMVNYSDRVELCWGVGDYGEHIYVTSYKVTDLVKELSDAQAVYWKFVNDNIKPSPKKVRVSISMADASKLDEKRNRIWSFGYEGTVLFVDGKIVAESKGAFDSSDYLVILAEFRPKTFSTQDVIDMTMLDLETRAKEGSDYSLEKDSPAIILLGVMVFIVILGIMFATPVFIVYLLLKRFGKFGRQDGSMDIQYLNERFKPKYQGEYYRDLANEEHFEDMTRLLFLMGRDISNWITAFFLRWISEGRLEPIKKETGLIFKKEKTFLKIAEHQKPFSELCTQEERKLWSYVTKAAGTNHILESGEFTTFILKKPNGLRTWRKNLLNHSKRVLLDRGMMREEERKKLFWKKRVIVLTEKGQKKREDIYRFYNYLYDFSLLNERDAVDVKLWDKLMIWAGALGITHRVEEEFKKLYPDYVKETVYRGDMVYVANTFARSARAGYAPSTTSSSSGGGGGFSSSGGGGGSFGGGSGGGVR